MQRSHAVLLDAEVLQAVNITCSYDRLQASCAVYLADEVLQVANTMCSYLVDELLQVARVIRSVADRQRTAV